MLWFGVGFGVGDGDCYVEEMLEFFVRSVIGVDGYIISIYVLFWKFCRGDVDLYIIDLYDLIVFF